MDAKRIVVNRDAIQAPPILYKYRNWNNPRHQTILSKQILYFAPPSSFEDEMEFKNFKRYDLMNDQEVYEKYFQTSLRENKILSIEEHSAFAMEWTQKAPFRDLDTLRRWQQQNLKEYDARIGVLSLTQFNNSVGMWNYYAKGGMGFCVGFDTCAIFKLGVSGGEVNYPDNGLPMINGTDSFDFETWKRVFNKEIKWKFEQEYRFTKFRIDGLFDRQLQTPKESIKQVIFGWDTSESTKKAIIQVCTDQHLLIEYFQLKKHNVEIAIEQIKD